MINKRKIQQKSNKWYKQNAVTSFITQKPKLSSQQRHDIVNEFLSSKTPQNELYKTIPDFPSDMEEETQSRMSNLPSTQYNKTQGTQPYLYTDEGLDSPNRLFEPRVGFENNKCYTPSLMKPLTLNLILPLRIY